MSKMLLARSVVIFVSVMAMTRQEYNDLRGWQLPENENGSDAGYLIEDSEGEQNTDKFKGFVQWLPKSEFERKYIVESDEKHPKEDEPKDMPVATVDFGSAVYALKQGKKVARSGWNGKGMYIRYVPTTNSLNEHLEIKNVKDTFDTWVPSISDLLAEDWVVL
mgnify:FL=1